MRASRAAAAGLAVAALAMAACSRAPAPAAGQVADAGAAPEACAKLQQRIDRCKANVKRGTFQFDFDPQATKDPALCGQADKMMDGIAQMTGCES